MITLRLPWPPSFAAVPLFRRGGAVAAYAIVDLASADAVLAHRWTLSPRGYAVRGRFPVFMHRFVLGLPRRGDDAKAQTVDHINGRPLDNRRCNLRIATPQQQAMNRATRRDNHTGHRGVNLDGRFWRARIHVRGRSIYLGSFRTREAAIAARLTAEREHFGEFAPGGRL